MAAKQYWFCVAGPIDPATYTGNGADAPPRMAVREALDNNFDTDGASVSSGWGVTAEQASDMFFVSHDDTTKIGMIRASRREGKPLSRCMRAWELLLEKEDKLAS